MPAKEIFDLKCEVNQLRALKDDAEGKLHTLQSMMREAGFPMRVKLGEDLHGNEDFARVRPECQLGDVLAELTKLRGEVTRLKDWQNRGEYAERLLEAWREEAAKRAESEDGHRNALGM